MCNACNQQVKPERTNVQWRLHPFKAKQEDDEFSYSIKMHQVLLIALFIVSGIQS